MLRRDTRSRVQGGRTLGGGEASVGAGLQPRQDEAWGRGHKEDRVMPGVCVASSKSISTMSTTNGWPHLLSFLSSSLPPSPFTLLPSLSPPPLPFTLLSFQSLFTFPPPPLLPFLTSSSLPPSFSSFLPSHLPSHLPSFLLYFPPGPYSPLWAPLFQSPPDLYCNTSPPHTVIMVTLPLCRGSNSICQLLPGRGSRGLWEPFCSG